MPNSAENGFMPKRVCVTVAVALHGVAVDRRSNGSGSVLLASVSSPSTR